MWLVSLNHDSGQEVVMRQKEISVGVETQGAAGYYPSTEIVSIHFGA